MAKEEKKGIGEQAKDAVIDARNELIVQSANLYILVRKVLLSSLGAVALSMDEANEVLAKLVERGEVAEADLQKMLNELRARRERSEAEAVRAREELSRKASNTLEESVETILTRLNVPNKSDIEELSRKISHLNEKVSALNHQRQNNN
ncbi:MAG: poly(hydroxyalkanoate) granule-associated protein [Chloroflexota bacterium]|jgi:poly(hydroxyalkanoate) granule-associated protein|nr:phasin family protein [Caldilinea sp.]GIK74230.1 MAG: poly(hydroxyalkanoate) granule-associated protein [Chloroflexota bacterium]